MNDKVDMGRTACTEDDLVAAIRTPPPDGGKLRACERADTRFLFCLRAVADLAGGLSRRNMLEKAGGK